MIYRGRLSGRKWRLQPIARYTWHLVTRDVCITWQSPSRLWCLNFWVIMTKKAAHLWSLYIRSASGGIWPGQKPLWQRVITPGLGYISWRFESPTLAPGTKAVMIYVLLIICVVFSSHNLPMLSHSIKQAFIPGFHWIVSIHTDMSLFYKVTYWPRPTSSLYGFGWVKLQCHEVLIAFTLLGKECFAI